MDKNALKAAEKALSGPLPNKGTELKLVLTAGTVIVVGIGIAFLLEDWHAFARSGAILVVLGVYIAWKDLVGELEGYKEAARKMYKAKFLQRAEDIVESNSERRMAQRAADRNAEGFSSEIEPLFELQRNRLRKIEATTLMAGTLIWGFGDLLCYLLPLNA